MYICQISRHRIFCCSDVYSNLHCHMARKEWVKSGIRKHTFLSGLIILTVLWAASDVKEEAALSHCIYLKLDAISDSVLLSFTIYSSTGGHEPRLKDRTTEREWKRRGTEKKTKKKRSKHVSTESKVRQAVTWLQSFYSLRWE